MRLTTTGLGIGTSSPGQKLEVAGNIFVNTSGNPYAEIKTSGAGNNPSLKLTADTNSWTFQGTFSNANDDLLVLYNATTLLDLTKDGNLGLGVTPSAVSVGDRVVQVGNFLFNDNTNGYGILRYNNFFNGTNDVYINTGAVSAFQMQGNAFKWYQAASGTAGNAISFTQAMTLDANGNFVLGTTSALSSSYRITSYGGRVNFAGNNDALNLYLQYSNGTAGVFIGSPAANVLAFSDSNGSERARITSGGFFKASNTGTYSSSTNDRYEFTSDKNDLTILVNSTNTGANVNNVYSQLPAGGNAGAYHFVGSISGSGLQFTVDADGDVKNTNNSYGSISDIKLKQDVVDAASQWDDIKALRVRKYRFKRNPDAALQIGLVAQEAEAVSPGLVEETADRDEEGNDLGTTTKSVKYSVLYMKAVKALQEAMTRIEQLEAKVAALESK
jgi:hypothetical protein